MILNRDDALYAANVFTDYFSNFGRIDDYLRKVKLERMSNYPTSLPGMGPEDDMFDNFDMHPNDMEFVCKEVSNEVFVNYLEIVTSHAVEVSVPGKSLKWVVYEKNSGKIAGFIRLGSPTINSKPRNDFLGKPLNTLDAPTMKRFNDSSIMGFIIVPTQPFGFNYLGGKLLAALCCSHELRELLNKKYNTEFCLFETTSLYGNIKGASMYDGMRPYLKYRGDTISSFLLTMGEDIYPELRDWFEEKNGGPLVKPEASSRKLKTQNKMIGLIKSGLKEHDTEKYNEFCECIRNVTSVTTNKRFYMSDYGYSNVLDVLTGKTDELKKSDQWEKYSLENITKWWKKKACKRYESLKSDNRIRTKLEYWNADSIDSIDIIR